MEFNGPQDSRNKVIWDGGTTSQAYNYEPSVLSWFEWKPPSDCNPRSRTWTPLSFSPWPDNNASDVTNVRNEAPENDTNSCFRMEAISLNSFPSQSPVLGELANRLQQMQTLDTTEKHHNMYRRFDDNNLRDPNPVGLDAHELLSKFMTGVSLKYLGDPFLRANQSANIPDALNTSVWITNLPPDLDCKMLLDSVRNCGKVYATVINGPDQRHATAASKLVFFDVVGAENLLRQARTGEFHVGGYMPCVCRNRIKTEAKAPSPNSRVLHIEGPNCIVNQSYLTALFHSDGITWQDEEVIILYSTESLTRLEWRFGSYRCQAESARHLIDRVRRREMATQKNMLWQNVTVHFGVDPCAPKPGEQFPWDFCP
ncbi:hypothetical protein GGS21DRAFT_148624 [Xylaria nigripes]|nr:hypothetical protein GGS21DRAFT_148624 [Xylaria nigripes]